MSKNYDDFKKKLRLNFKVGKKRIKRLTSQGKKRKERNTPIHQHRRVVCNSTLEQDWPMYAYACKIDEMVIVIWELKKKKTKYKEKKKNKGLEIKNKMRLKYAEILRTARLQSKCTVSYKKKLSY